MSHKQNDHYNETINEGLKLCCKCPEGKELIFCGCKCHKTNQTKHTPGPWKATFMAEGL